MADGIAGGRRSSTRSRSRRAAPSAPAPSSHKHIAVACESYRSVADVATAWLVRAEERRRDRAAVSTVPDLHSRQNIVDAQVDAVSAGLGA
jgi:hypothetical protein